ncbi:MAG TPA: hypothetical protein VNV44_12905 [Solirubrobacteraceae bacterium]|nr:hypothetical protein [Solirubrobacteraceae bacterium]
MTKKFRGIAPAATALAVLASTAALASPSWATKGEKPPKHTAAPTISGQVVDGRLLTVTNGAWTGTPPLEYAYQWYRCVHGCAAIGEATEPTYRVQTADLAHKLRAVVTAMNKAGAGKAKTAFTAFVQPGSPLNLAPPSISGTVLPNETLTAENGTWVGTPPIIFGWQWYGCLPVGGCKAISGATMQTHVIGAGEAGDGFKVVVEASNTHGSEAVESAEAPAVGGGL